MLAAIFTLATELDVSIADIEIAHSIEGDEGVLILLVDAELRASACRAGSWPTATARRCARSDDRDPFDAVVDPLPIEPLRRPGRRRRWRSRDRRASPTGPSSCAALADGHEHPRRRAVRRRHRGDARVPGPARRRASTIDRASGDRRVDGGRRAAPTGPARARRPPVGHDRPVRRSRARRSGRDRTSWTGDQPLRARPMGDGLDALLRALGVEVEELERAGPPARLTGQRAPGRPAARSRVAGRRVEPVPVGPPAGRAVLRPTGSRIGVDGPLVSRPYVDMTIEVMRGVRCRGRRGSRPTEQLRGARRRATGRRTYRDRARCVGRLATSSPRRRSPADGCASRGSAPTSLQGDVAFVDVLEQMGAEVERGERLHRGPRHGTAARRRRSTWATCPTPPRRWPPWPCSPTAPTEVTGIGFIRRKETDRIAAVVTELQRCGIDATETDDGFRIEPGCAAAGGDPDLRRPPHGHELRPARAAGGRASRIADPGCVAKTFPDYWDVLDQLRADRRPARRVGCPPDEGDRDRRTRRLRQVHRGPGARRAARPPATSTPGRCTARWRSRRCAGASTSRKPSRSAKVARDLDLRMDDDGTIAVDGVDATIEIRGPEVTRAVSIVAANPEVRERDAPAPAGVGDQARRRRDRGP